MSVIGEILSDGEGLVLVFQTAAFAIAVLFAGAAFLIHGDGRVRVMAVALSSLTFLFSLTVLDMSLPDLGGGPPFESMPPLSVAVASFLCLALAATAPLLRSWLRRHIPRVIDDPWAFLALRVSLLLWAATPLMYMGLVVAQGPPNSIT